MFQLVGCFFEQVKISAICAVVFLVEENRIIYFRLVSDQ
jgi:hypothetical protein